VSADPPTKQFVERWDGVIESINRELAKLLDLVHYMMLDVRMYSSIIEQRYELKEQNEVEQVEQLEKNFEAGKDAFLQHLRDELARNRATFQQLIYEQNKRLHGME